MHCSLLFIVLTHFSQRNIIYTVICFRVGGRDFRLTCCPFELHKRPFVINSLYNVCFEMCLYGDTAAFDQWTEDRALHSFEPHFS